MNRRKKVRREKKIFIKAYTENNLGDDLFVFILCQRYPHCEFLMPCSLKYRRAFRHIENLKLLPVIPFVDGLLYRLGHSFRVKRSFYRKVMQECDATVHIGGSLFIEYMFPHSEIEQYLKDVQASNHYYLLGTNFGPYDNEAFKEKVRKLFYHLDDICFRDQYSYQMFEDLDNVRSAPDIVFGLDKSDFTQSSKEEHVLISVISLAGRPKIEEFQQAYEDKITEVAQSLLNKGVKVTLMSFCRAEGDEDVAERINDKLEGRANLYYYKNDLIEALELFNKATGVVATRFHALVLAWVFNCRVYPMSYSPKMTNVLQDVGFDQSFTELNKVDKVNVDTVVNQLTQGAPLDVTHYAQQAIKHFDRLDKQLAE